MISCFMGCELISTRGGGEPPYFFDRLITRPAAVVLLVLLLLLFSESIVRLTVLPLLLLPLRLSKRSLNLLLLLLLLLLLPDPDLPEADVAGLPRCRHRRCHHHHEPPSSSSSSGAAAGAAYSQECLTLPFSWRGGLRGLPMAAPGLPIAYSVAWLATCWMPFSMQDW